MLGPFELSLNFHVLRIMKEEKAHRINAVLEHATRIARDKGDPTPYLLSQLLLLND